MNPDTRIQIEKLYRNNDNIRTYTGLHDANHIPIMVGDEVEWDDGRTEFSGVAMFAVGAYGVIADIQVPPLLRLFSAEFAQNVPYHTDKFVSLWELILISGDKDAIMYGYVPHLQIKGIPKCQIVRQDTCVCCGRPVPEGRQVCRICEFDACTKDTYG